MLLFGSRCRSDHRPDSDIDVIIEDHEDPAIIAVDLLICNGGSVDAFFEPGADGWAWPVGDESGRMLLMFDEHGLNIEYRPITLQDLMALVQERNQAA